MDFIDKIGTSLAVGGVVLVGREDPVLIMLPGNELFAHGEQHTGACCDPNNDEDWIEIVNTDAEQFKQIVRQMDLQEVNIMGPDGSKIIVRKTQRSHDQRVTWEVYRRDGYRCRYCGREGGENGATLSYDHVKLWEDGGEWTVENGVTACRKCNKQRGNTPFDEWLESDIYKRKSRNVEQWVLDQNKELAAVYKGFPTRISTRRR